MSQEKQQANQIRYTPGSRAGHYESYFQRANHPTDPLAFWIRYTLFSPEGAPENALGELWAIFFDGEQGCSYAVKNEFPIADCLFSPHAFDVRMPKAQLNEKALKGAAASDTCSIQWDLSYASDEPPAYILSPWLYKSPIPKAKGLIGSPLATYAGTLKVNEQTVDIDGWVGSQNHNWGVKHTDQYAWVQVAGFDHDPNAFFECITGQIQIGNVLSPKLSFATLRIDGETYNFNGLRHSLLAKGQYNLCQYSLTSKNHHGTLHVSVQATPEQFVALPYFNPPGGTKICHNTKIASCEITLQLRKGKKIHLTTEHRAAYEVLGDSLLSSNVPFLKENVS